MLNTFWKIWDFSKNRHQTLIKSVLFSFIRCSFAVTELVAVIAAIQVLTNVLDIRTGLIRIAVCTAVCIVGTFFSNYLEQILSMETGFFMVGDKRVSIGNLLQRVPLGYFNDQTTDHITTVLTSVLLAVESGGIVSLLFITSGLFNAAAICLFMLFYDWRIGLLTALGMAVYACVVNWQMKLSRENAPILQAAQNELSKASLTFLQGIKVTKAFSNDEGDRNLRKAVASSCSANLKLTDQSMPAQFTAHLVIAVFESLLLLATGYLFLVQKDITLVKAIVLIIFSFMAYGALHQAGSMLSMIGLLDSSLDAVAAAENAEQLQDWTPAQNADSDEIVFHNVSFSFGSREVLHHISTVIQPQSLTAIIGPSGSGKTTLCQLIPRFRDVSSGSITIGGADIRNIPAEELMKKISIVFQNVFLFEDTIFNNIRFGKPDATLEEVRRAAAAARCDEFIMALPDGYNTIVKEGGSSLSGGEKQRISIARAILKDSPIIILDEATSALDAENEHDILAAIDELTKNKTVIMIAHRIPSVKKADHIIAIRDGYIVQEGTHEELISENGMYNDFIAAREQAAGWVLTSGK